MKTHFAALKLTMCWAKLFKWCFTTLVAVKHSIDIAKGENICYEYGI